MSKARDSDYLWMGPMSELLTLQHRRRTFKRSSDGKIRMNVLTVC